MKPFNNNSKNSDCVYFEKSKMNIFEYYSFWKEQKQKSLIFKKLAIISQTYLREGYPRYFAIFAYDGNSNLVNLYGYPENWQIDLILSFLDSKKIISGVALDIGANIGTHAVRFANYYDEVICFEPHPMTSQLLAYNLKSYAPNSSFHRLGLFSVRKKMQLSDGASTNIGAFSVCNSIDDGEVYDVECVPLDEIDSIKNKNIGLIKIDTEGAEFDVLKGAVNTIEKNHPVIIMEDWQSKNGIKSDAVQLLEKYGYVTFLHPLIYPERRNGKGFVRMINYVINVMEIVLKSSSYVIRKCYFDSPEGYELLVALHKDHI